MEEAASVPLAYVTAFYALVIRGAIRKQSVVLIHLAATPVGQACIRIAREFGCMVLAGVENEADVEFLVKDMGIHRDMVITATLAGEQIHNATEYRGKNHLLS